MSEDHPSSSSALAGFRVAGENIIKEQSLIRPLQISTYKLHLPTLDCGESSVALSPSGKVVHSFGLEKSASVSTLDTVQEDSQLHSSVQEPQDVNDMSFSSENSFGTSGHRPGLFSFIANVTDRWVKASLVRSEKKISAEREVLKTYHESFLYGDIPLSVQMKAFFRWGYMGSIIAICEAVATFASVALYIYSTYTADEAHWVSLCRNATSIFFLFDFLLNLYITPLRATYLLSLQGFIDFVSMLPVLFITLRRSDLSSLPAVLTSLRILRALPLLRQMGIVTSAITLQFVVLLAGIVVMLMVGAGIFHWVEKSSTPQALMEGIGCSALGCFSYFQSFYFMVVTVSTVGYGEIHPYSGWGRLVCIVVIVLAITFIPAQINRILSVTNRRPYGGSFSARKIVGSRYIVLWGTSSFLSIQQFLSQLYHPVHNADHAALPLRVVIMAPSKPSFELQSLLALYGGLVEFIEGTLLRSSDLDRVAARSASAFFVLADRQAEDFEREDSLQFIRALAAHRFCGSSVRVMVEVLKPRTQGSAMWDDMAGVEVLCTDAMRFKLLARSCAVKGLTTFCANLFSNSIQLQRQPKYAWLKEYAHGQVQNVYPVLLPELMHGLFFMEAVEFIYQEYGLVLFGLDIPTPSEDADANQLASRRTVLLSPWQHQISPSDVGILIAPNLYSAQALSALSDMAAARHPFTSSREYQAKSAALQRVRDSWSAWRQALSSSPDLEIGTTVNILERYGRQLPHSHDEAPLVYQLNEAYMGSLAPSSTMPPSLSLYQSRSQSSQSRSQSQSLSRDGSTRNMFNSRSTAGVRDPSTLSYSDSGSHRGEATAQGLTLGDMAEEVLVWPPRGDLSIRPHPAVLDRQSSKILAHLESRTLTAVYLKSPHVIVAMPLAWPENFFNFVLSLRLPGFPAPAIVILADREPSQQEWGCVGHFHAVFFVKGSASYEFDLMRAGVLNAEKIVILSSDASPGQVGAVETADEQQPLMYDPSNFSEDMRNLLVVANVERLLRGSRRQQRVLCEMHNQLSFAYMRPKYVPDRSQFEGATYFRNPHNIFTLSPPYMEGKAFGSTSLQFLMYESFFNRHSTTILEKLLDGELVEQPPSFSAIPGSYSHGSSRRATFPNIDSGGNGIRSQTASHQQGESGSRIRCVKQGPVPERLAGKTFGEAFVSSLHEDGQILLGLYRCGQVEASPSPYVFTNPWKNCTLHNLDLLYYI